MNKTTTITLNDRFSMIKQTSNQPRGRSRSRSRSMNRRQPSDTQLRGSRKNQKLLDQLEKQHKMRLAMKLKNKSILRSRGGRVQSRVQGRVQGQIVRNGLKRAATVKKNNQRNFKRSNSMTTFVPLKDTPGTLRNNRARSRSRSRNRSQTRNITERLGIRQPRRRMRRGAAQSNGGQQQQQTQQQGGRSRSRSRVRLNRNNFNNRNSNNQAQSKRSNSVNNRLGNSGPTRAQSQRGRRVFNNQRIGTAQMNRGPIAGRIVKRQKNLNAGGRIQKLRKNGANTLGAQATRGRVIKRGGRAGLNSNRGRSQQRGNRTQQQQNKNGPARRGRSRTRRGGSAQNQNTRGGKSQISKEQLDKQLDDYMSKGSA